MDDKREGKRKDKKTRKSRSRSRDKQRSESRSPATYGHRRGGRSRSRERTRRRSPSTRRRHGRRSPSAPPPPTMQTLPAGQMMAGDAGTAYMGSMYSAYGGYPPAAAAGYMGGMEQDYAGYGYAAAPAGVPAAGHQYGGMMMMDQTIPGAGNEYAVGWEAAPAVPVVQETEEEKRKREAAIALEVRNQRASLKKQRDDYKQRSSALKRELKILKQQRADLSAGREPPSPTTNSFIKENDKLQSQIQSKISTIENVIDMLEGIIGKDKTPTPPPPTISGSVGDKKGLESPRATTKERKHSESSGSSERLKNEVLQTMKRGKAKAKDGKNDSNNSNFVGAELKRKQQYNYIYYDPELHWCSACNVFPKTAKEYLNHLHSEGHMSKSLQSPWREKQTPEEPSDPELPNKRAPIRGLQFFVPATAWYCKVCHYWMGDLHSASTHLKSRLHAENYEKHIDLHPNFETDWMSDRQKAFERARDNGQLQAGAASGVPDIVPGPVSAPAQAEIDFLAGGGKPPAPVAAPAKDSDPAATKKKKKAKKADKKKKKRSKKKKRAASSSSSSSSSSDSDSDAEKKPAKGDFDPATSIRVAMRNILKAQEAAHELDGGAAAGKWTVIQAESALQQQELCAPPPPFLTEDAENREKKRDELMLSQWVTPEPVISESEKKLLEQLKGKLKKRDDIPPDSKYQPSDDNRSRGGGGDERRSRSGSPSWKRGSDRRSRSISPLWRRNASPRRYGGGSPGRRGGARNRRSPDRRRDMDRGGRFDRRRRSRSRPHFSPNHGRDRFRRRRSSSRSRSRSRGRRVIEKPIVNYPPEPKPRPEKKVRERKDDDKKERKPVPVPVAGQKKLPFIGRMPVFKKQQQEVKKDDEPVTEYGDYGTSTAPVENGTKQQPEEFVDMMPDPFQYVALMGAPPPPPALPSKPDEMLPPGIDETESDLVPKPISDAPIPRKGPLPRDFQEALDIIFDGDKPKSAELIAHETKPPEIVPPLPVAPPLLDIDQPQMIVPEAIEIYNQQIAAQYSTAVVSAAAVSYDDESQNQPLEMGSLDAHSSDSQTQPPNTNSSDNNTGSDEASGDEVVEPLEPPPPPPEIENEETRRKRAELAELAMLGIDADDMAAQIF